MKTQALIDGVVQQTTVLIAHLATAGGIRAPLARIANRVFLELSEELQRQGVKKNVIADMFGMALRTYHRRVRSLAGSETEGGHTVWDAVLDYVRDEQPVSLHQIKRRFRNDEPSVVSGVLNDLVGSGFVYRSGRGDGSVFRLADARDFEQSSEEARREASEHLVWLAIYRHGPATRAVIAAELRLGDEELDRALQTLLSDGRIEACDDGGAANTYRSTRFDVPVGASQGWEAAVLDHFQAMVTAMAVKLRSGRARARSGDETGGATYTIDVWPGHPFESEARGLLAETRKRVDDLRERVDAHNARVKAPAAVDAVVFYAGQYVKGEEETRDDE
ncbi:MAG: winged helix DNA-binding domain-containing protein [Myxococcales bacterium]|nr:winged helix DNA-binding domain-containing protein [Myxococcales bacterium]